MRINRLLFAVGRVYHWKVFISFFQPPLCNEVRRRRRDSSAEEKNKAAEGLDGGTPATIEVYSGLYVNEASDLASRSDFADVFRERVWKNFIFKYRIIFFSNNLKWRGTNL